MILTIENMVEALAQHVAQTENRSLAEARSAVRLWVAAAQQKYRAAGMPHGDTVAGFLIWLTEHRVALAA
jgi:hypothetical protein